VDEHDHACQLVGSKGQSSSPPVRRRQLTVQTVIIAYVTVPSVSSYPESARDPTGQGLQASAGNMSDLLKRYTVREVILVGRRRLACADSVESIRTCPETRLVRLPSREATCRGTVHMQRRFDRTKRAYLFGSLTDADACMSDEPHLRIAQSASPFNCFTCMAASGSFECDISVRTLYYR
jgi:hypothetical protein